MYIISWPRTGAFNRGKALQANQSPAYRHASMLHDAPLFGNIVVHVAPHTQVTGFSVAATTHMRPCSTCSFSMIKTRVAQRRNVCTSWLPSKLLFLHFSRERLRSTAYLPFCFSVAFRKAFDQGAVGWYFWVMRVVHFSHQAATCRKRRQLAP